MHPILVRTARLFAYLAAWVPVTAILTGLLALSGGLTLLESALLSPALTLVFAFVCLSSWYICRSMPPTRDTAPRIVLTFGAAAVIAGALWVVWGTTVASLLGVVPRFVTLPDRMAKAAFVIFGLGFLLYLLVVFLHYVLLASEAIHETDRRRAELLTLEKEAQLRALKEQLNPHFLFNSLNSISALTTVDPARAREMCVLLADFLRKTLGLSDRPDILLSEEIQLLESYLAIERVRFGNRLRVEIDVEPGLLELPVPPLLLQPIVENAVKHGIAPLPDGGLLKLSARRSGGKAVIVVENPADPDERAQAGAGVGLANVARRLAVRWGVGAALASDFSSGLYRVRITLPVEEPPAEQVAPSGVPALGEA